MATLSRREFLAGALAAGALPMVPTKLMAGGHAQALYAAARAEADGSFSAVLFTTEGDAARMALPGRGHDLTFRPGTRECVVFARRPGRFAGVFSDDAGRAPVWFASSEGRHFDGHGVYSSNSQLLFSSENDYTGDESRGVIGVRDAGAGYKQIGEFASAGMDPHDMALLSDGRTLVVANGGIEMDPETGRIPLNLASMEPSLAYIDSATGDVLECHLLDKSLHKLSIRHLAVTANDLVVFGCQYEGPAADFPPLLGFHRRGEQPMLVPAPGNVHRDLKNYIGSVAADASGTIIAASAPKGGLITFWDAENRRYLGEKRLADGCGIAGEESKGSFVLTSGTGQVVEHMPLDGFSRTLTSSAWTGTSWDNHIVRL
jgi:uncharacterized protein